MGMDYWECQQDEAMSEYFEERYVEEFKDRAVEEFTAERLRSYYVDNDLLLYPFNLKIQVSISENYP
ncbi:hypothetical protein DXE05_25030 [Vibrio parahaemolyticus]|nr:hypothetical protein DXE05_25030 [Vibrio parahaemolyticus]